MATQEDIALSDLKNRLGVPHSPILVPCAAPPTVVDGFLIRYLRHCGLNPERVVERLRQRRRFEHALPAVTVSPAVVAALRAGVFSVIGEDILHRPVILVRTSLYRPAPDDGSTETDRLLLVVLLYAEALTMRHFSSARRGADDGSEEQKAANYFTTDGYTPAAALNQECLFIFYDGVSPQNEEDHSIDSGAPSRYRDGWSSDGSSALTTEVGVGGVGGSSNVLLSRLTALAAKYFPRLLGAVLVVEGGWALRQGVRAVRRAASIMLVKPDHERETGSTIKNTELALPGSEGGSSKRDLLVDELKSTAVRVVRIHQLARYVDEHVLPVDLGGRKMKQAGRHNTEGGVSKDGLAPQSPADLSQQLLRHWFNAVTFFTMESTINKTTEAATEGGIMAVQSSHYSRPLWMPPPLRYPAELIPGVPTRPMDQDAPLVGFYTGVFGGFSRRGSLMGSGDDDGICSVISDSSQRYTELNESRNDSAAKDGGPEVTDAPGNTKEEATTRIDAAKADKLFEELERERRRREAAEFEVRKLSLGIAFDDCALTSMESSLRAAHEEVNTLVSEVLQRAKAAQSAVLGGHAADHAGAAPTLPQLLEFTHTAILQAANERSAIPAMASSRSLEERGSRCCVQ